VRRAFLAFLARRGRERPFILAGHSQGSVLLERLLDEEISRTPLREHLIAAYLIGGRVTVDGLRARAPDIAPCRTRTDLHCVVAWNAREVSYTAGRWELRLRDGEPRVCTNPLSWQNDEAFAPASQNLGAVFMETADRSPRPGFADAQCIRGVLRIRAIGAVPRDVPSRILDYVLGSGNRHPVEYQIFYANLRANAIERAAAAQITKGARVATRTPFADHARSRVTR
jgi:hypothetical protein